MRLAVDVVKLLADFIVAKELSSRHPTLRHSFLTFFGVNNSISLILSPLGLDTIAIAHH